MGVGATLIIVVAAIAVFLLAYRLKAPAALPPARPSFCFLPKYAFAIRLPANLTSASDPVAELSRLLAPLGFAESKRTADSVRYSRGSLLGDFSVEVAKVHLDVSLPLVSESHVRVAYGSFAAFDTGDLWSFCTELNVKVAPAAQQSR